MSNKIITSLKQINRWLPILAIAMLPIKLNLSYVFLYTAILLSALIDFKKLKEQLLSSLPILLPLYLFILYGLLTACLGVSFSISTIGLFKLLFLTLSISIFTKAFCDWGLTRCCWILILSQTMTAIYSLFEAQLPDIKHLFLGTVTESGQLALVVPLALGLYKFNTAELKFRPVLFGLLTFSCAILFAFSNHWQLDPTIYLFLLLILAIIIFFNWKVTFSCLKNNVFTQSNKALLYCFLPLLAAALAVNLKRGPWFGVFIASCCFLMFKARRLALLVIILSLLLVSSLQPLRERLQDSLQHFSIAGGRQVMWSIAGDLLTRYPLGTGFETSSILQKFAREIPPEHKHFHSNYINIAVEMGFIGFALFAWWILRLLSLGFRHWRNSVNPELLLSASCAIISWSLAALVEYNFGDSEVLLVLFFVIALMSKLLDLASNSARTAQ